MGARRLIWRLLSLLWRSAKSARRLIWRLLCSSSWVWPSKTWPYFTAIAGLALIIAAIAKLRGLSVISSTSGAAASFAALELFDELVSKPKLGFSCFAGGHFAVTVILFATPAKTAKQTAYAVIGGHVLASAVALLHLAALPDVAAFMTKIVLGSAVVAVMSFSGAVHPPACAFAFALVSGNKGVDFTYGPILGCCVLVACQQVWLALPGGKAKAKAA